MTAAPAMIGRLSVAETGAVYLCELGDGKYLRLSQAAHDLYRSVENGVSFEELAEVARRSRPGVDAADVERAYRLVVDKLTAARERRVPRRSGFWLTFALLPSRLVERVARPLAFAYHPAFAALLVIVIALGGWLAVTRDAIATSIGPADFGAGYLIFLGSLIAHELGHAAACVRYGARPGPIGVTMYLLYPAFYTDVSAVWALPRRQRVVVDLGGTYFQMVVATGLVVAQIATGWEPLRVALLLSVGACMLSLNPVMKFDGYWVVADALGVTNLGQVPARLGAAIWARLRRRRAIPLPWSWPMVTVLGIYSVASTLVWGYFLWFLGHAVVGLGSSYPGLVVAVAAPLGDGILVPSALFALFSATLMVVFGALILRHALTLLLRSAASLLRRR